MENTIYNDENVAKYFAGELDEHKLELMEKKLLNDKEKEKEISDFSRLWEKSAELATYEKIDADADWQSVRSRMGFGAKAGKISFARYFSRIAAILILAVGLAYLFSEIVDTTILPGRATNDYLQYSATEAAGEFTLPDNSKVALNKGSSLYYNSNYSTDNRDVILEGEGYFEVEKNKTLPFRVFVNNSTVEVLGTAFNIRPGVKEVTVSVLNGHVAFYETSKKENRIELLQNEQSKFDTKSRVFAPKSVLNQNALAWHTRRLIFRRDSLKNVFETLAVCYGKELETNNITSFDVKLFTSEYLNEPLEDILNDINAVYAGRYSFRITDDKLIVQQKN
ncbi:MAG: FecR domain-containing protein [Bacteroidales bacterium]|nr:FecR domain-containing protein [Bacteroidales bacterium]